MMTASDDTDTAIKVVREGLVGVIESADPDKLVRIARAIEVIEQGPDRDELMTALREEAGRRR
jgi:hypothetical protein